MKSKKKIYEVELIDVGRSNHCEKFKVITADMGEVGEKIVNKSKLHLMSDNVWLAEAKGSTDKIGIFNINAGFHSVGKAKVVFK